MNYEYSVLNYLKKGCLMKKYALMIAMGSLLCMTQAQASSYKWETFKEEVGEEIDNIEGGFRSDLVFGYITEIAERAKLRAARQRIPAAEAASMVIDQFNRRIEVRTSGPLREKLLLNIPKIVNWEFGIK